MIAIGDPAARLDLARDFGADIALSVSRDDAGAREETVRGATGGRGVDVVIEAAGNPAAIEEGFRLLREGGRYVIAGHHTDVGEATINPHRDINRPHREVRGQWGTGFRHIYHSLRLLAKHNDRLPFSKIIGGRYGLEDAATALSDVESLRVTKAIITPT